MTEIIKHEGRVESIAKGMVNVRIIQSSACSACSAAHLCHSSESKEKVISIPTASAATYQVGQNVTISGSVQQGMRATLWAYVVPLLLVVAALIVASLVHLGDGVSALLALGVLVVYYVVMYMMRGLMERKFAFVIEE